MRNPFQRKRMNGEFQQRQPGCMWTLVHTLYYHHWHVLKFNQRQKYRALMDDKCNLSSPEKQYGGLDGFETAQLGYGDVDSPHLHAKKSNAIRKQSLRSRVKSLFGKELVKEHKDIIDKEAFCFETELQGTYLESLNVDWKHPLILLPGNLDTPESKTAGEEEVTTAKPNNMDNPDILEIFKVDKGSLIKHLHDGDETIANFSRNVLGLNTKLELSRSRSFPFTELSKGKKHKPVKLETKCEDHNKFQDTSSQSSLWFHSDNSDSDMRYVRHLLDQSGIVGDPSGMTWHDCNQPLSPKLFEKVETCWPHEHDGLSPEYLHGCWHHLMLFDLVNEAILEIYDEALPYYPRALSSRCYVRPFPVGKHMMEEVSASVGMLLNMEAEETMQWVDCMMGWELGRHLRWLNLQLETECVGVELEEAILYELVEEVVSW